MIAVLQAEVVRDAQPFAALEPDWWELWRGVAAATPFQSPAWLIPWWRHFGPGALFVVTVRAAGRLVGLAPFYVEDGTRRLLPLGISVSDHLDVLLAPGFEALAGQALAAAAERAGAMWDEWSLEELAPDALAWNLPTPHGCDEGSAAQSACPVLEFPSDADGIWRFVPARRRRDTNLARNRAARRGEVRIEPMDADAPGFLDTLFRLHGARWQSRGEDGVLAHDQVQRFQRAALPRLAAAGLTRCFVLRIGEAAAAAHYGLAHRQRAYVYLTGFDPGFAFESPGVILMAHAVEQAFREGARSFHFLRGPEPYKYAWGASDRWNNRRLFRRIDRRGSHA